jgi:hypothetical protein
MLPLNPPVPRLTPSWADALVAYADLCNKHTKVLTFDTKVTEAILKETDDARRHDIAECWLEYARVTVQLHTKREEEKRLAYDLHLSHYTERFSGLYPYSDDALASVRYVSFYTVSRECYSPAEGGCWFDRHTLVATLPIVHFRGYDLGVSRETLFHLAEGEGARMELNFDLILLETFPAEHQTLRTPRYE